MQFDAEDYAHSDYYLDVMERKVEEGESITLVIPKGERYALLSALYTAHQKDLEDGFKNTSAHIHALWKFLDQQIKA